MSSNSFTTKLINLNIETTNEPFNGKTSHLSFCPPLHKMDCPVFEEVSRSQLKIQLISMFRNIYKLQCIVHFDINKQNQNVKNGHWDMFVIILTVFLSTSTCHTSEIPPTHFFIFRGKIVTDLKFTAKIPNICKYCQSGRHFGWECPAAQKVPRITTDSKI